MKLTEKMLRGSPLLPISERVFAGRENLIEKKPFDLYVFFSSSNNYNNKLLKILKFYI